MNTIMITGTSRTSGNNVVYSLIIWGSRAGEALQMVTANTYVVLGYNAMWNIAKGIATLYFKEIKFTDGAYTQYLDHIINLDSIS